MKNKTNKNNKKNLKSKLIPNKEFVTYYLTNKSSSYT